MQSLDVWEGHHTREQGRLDRMRENLPLYAGSIWTQQEKVEVAAAALARARAAIHVPPPGLRGECPSCAQDFGPLADLLPGKHHRGF